MHKLFWEVFKKTGNIEAYLYLYDYKLLNKEKDAKGEILNNDGDCKYPRNST